MRVGSIDSKWWYGVAGPALMEIVGFGAMILLGETGLMGRATDASDPALYVGLGFALVALLGLFLTPVFAYSAYRDATAVRESTAEWNPNPAVWGVGALVVPLAGVMAGTALLWFVAVPYLYKRFSTHSVAVDPDADLAEVDEPTPSTDRDQWGADSSSTGSDQWNSDATTAEPGRGDETENDRPEVSPTTDTGPGSRSAAAETTSHRDESEAQSDSGGDSRWWYGVAAGVFCGGVFFASLTVFMVGYLAASTGEALRSAFLGGSPILTMFAVGGAFAWLLTTPVFAISLVADSRRLRAGDGDWKPDSLSWNLVAAGHLVAIFMPIIALLTIPAGGVYLKRRRERVGRS